SAQLYPRTRAVAESLRAADVRVKSREPKIAQRDQEFSEVIAAGMAARNFIRDGWPTGTQRAFEKAAHIDPDYTPQDFTKYEEALREEQEEQ
ncbi:hypothetical protein, partial [Tessaracoccus sp. OH4464_COT-324]|uniref:hypothetical protein n=1 Tax=Tessaracoccus sp. OH4464_COT-324 TaxID=2491059 RepID=UPI001319E45F